MTMMMDSPGHDGYVDRRIDYHRRSSQQEERQQQLDGDETHHYRGVGRRRGIVEKSPTIMLMTVLITFLTLSSQLDGSAAFTGGSFTSSSKQSSFFPTALRQQHSHQDVSLRKRQQHNAHTGVFISKHIRSSPSVSSRRYFRTTTNNNDYNNRNNLSSTLYLSCDEQQELDDVEVRGRRVTDGWRSFFS
jgi:hypothetical protein